MKELRLRAEQLGCTIVVGNHYKVYYKGVLVTTLSSTPSDNRAILNSVSSMRRGSGGVSVDVRRMTVTVNGVVVS